MPYKEPKVEKLFYSIGEVARMFDVNTSLIRFWEKEFDIIKPKKNKKGNRLFTKGGYRQFSHHLSPGQGKGHDPEGCSVKDERKQRRRHT